MNTQRGSMSGTDLGLKKELGLMVDRVWKKQQELGICWPSDQLRIRWRQPESRSSLPRRKPRKRIAKR